ncbi:MAG: hypothetical protein J6I84_03015 [Bacilli bacterium]|nr:hypothetical protein [Bacilli bacterium]
MVRQGYNNRIRRFKGMKGLSRLAVKDRITESILSHNSGTLKLKFLESQRKETEMGEWNEYYILLTYPGISETSEYLRYLMKDLDKYLVFLGTLGTDNIGLQELECDNGNYDILIYIISNGTDKEKYRDI